MLGIVIVNFKTMHETVGYIKQELVKITTPNKIVVVDVACEHIAHAREIAEECDGQFLENVDTVPDCDKEVYVLPHKDNLGYAKGNNLGAAFLSKHFHIEFFLFSNNDLELVHGDVAERLMEEARQHDDIGAIGPSVLDIYGNPQSPMKYCNIWKRIILPFGLFPVLYPFLRAGFFSDTIRNAPLGVYYRLMGCFFMVKASVFIAVGGFDEGTFLYAEEMILSERMKQIGKKMYYTPAVAVLHAQGEVIGQSLDTLHALQLRFRSELYFYRKYRAISGFADACACCAISLYSRFYYPIFRAIWGCLTRKQGVQTGFSND